MYLVHIIIIDETKRNETKAVDERRSGRGTWDLGTWDGGRGSVYRTRIPYVPAMHCNAMQYTKREREIESAMYIDYGESKNKKKSLCDTAVGLYIKVLKYLLSIHTTDWVRR